MHIVYMWDTYCSAVVFTDVFAAGYQKSRPLLYWPVSEEFAADHVATGSF